MVNCLSIALIVPPPHTGTLTHGAYSASSLAIMSLLQTFQTFWKNTCTNMFEVCMGLAASGLVWAGPRLESYRPGWAANKIILNISLQLCGAAWSSRWLMVQLTNGQHTCELVFKPKADILNIGPDYQFVFSVLDELYVSHHAWCSRCCSKSAL